MYSGTTLTNSSGNIIGTHQKIDRIARRALKSMLKDGEMFPSRRLLLHFEGKNGPDGMKSKSAGSEPWYFYDPYDPEDGELLQQINEHYKSLTNELKNKNMERSAFEASWLAHALIDGLTPAHQFPYEQQLNDLHGNTKEERDTVLKKIVAPGDSTIEKINNNWKIWGAKGLCNQHGLFEFGAGVLMLSLSPKIAVPSRQEIKSINHLGLSEYYKRTAREVALLDMYTRFYHRGWSPSLLHDVKKELAPRMAKIVTLAWYMAAKEAKLSTEV